MACALLLALLTASQPVGTVRGRIVDARTGAGLPQVLVQVEPDGPSTRTDSEGSFALEGVAAGARRLFVSVVGHILVRRDVAVPAGGAVDVTIPLSEGTGTYTETVTVTADRFRPSEPAVAAQQTLGSAEIQNLRGVLADDPLRAVQVLPGVTTGDDLRSEFSVRGSAFNRMTLTVDGVATPFVVHTVRAIEDYSQSGSVAMINSDILEEVTLLNGAYAQKFGNRTGAELDFRLREGSRARRQARAAVSGTNASFVAEGPIRRASGHKALTHSAADSGRPSELTRGSGDSSGSGPSALAIGSGDSGGSEPSALTRGSGDSGGSGPSALTRGSWLFSFRQSYLDLLVERLMDEALQFGFTDAQAKFVCDFTPSHRGELTLVAGRSRLQNNEDIDPEDLWVGRNASAIAIAAWRVARARSAVTTRVLGAYNRFENDSLSAVRLDEGTNRQAAARVDATVQLLRTLRVEGGGEVERTGEQRTRQRPWAAGQFAPINDYSGHATRVGAYGQMEWTAGPLTIVPGVRGDRWSLTRESTTSPWVQGELRLPHSVSLRAGAGRYHQFPEFEQAVGAFAVPGARSERATHADVGLEQRLGGAIRWQATFYHRDEDRFFHRPFALTQLSATGRVVRGLSGAGYEQQLEGHARGVELLVQRKGTTGLTGWVSYSYGRHRVRDAVLGETYWGDLDQRHTFNVYLFYRRSDRLSFSAKLRAGSNVPAPGYYAERDGRYFVSSERNAVRLPAYSRLDLRANRTFNWSRSRLTLFAEVINVLNRENVRFNPPGINMRTGQVSRLFEPLLPIVPSAGILIEF